MKSIRLGLRLEAPERYLAEFDFRYNRRTALGWNDKEIARGIDGKRLTYRRTDKAANE